MRRGSYRRRPLPRGLVTTVDGLPRRAVVTVRTPVAPGVTAVEAGPLERFLVPDDAPELVSPARNQRRTS